MQVDNEYLQCLGLGLHGLRASGQFCDAMVCVGSTRILVHKVVISAASKTLHDLAQEFDMTPHRERDQLEIIIPPDVSLYAVNMFINFLYTGQIELNSRVVSHLERLATLFGVSRLQILCQEYIQKNAPPDSQNLNLRPEYQIEPDSSINGAHPGNREERLISTPDDTSQSSNVSRSNSVCSVKSGDLGASFGGVTIKSEPAHLALYEAAASKHSSTGFHRNGSKLSSSSHARNQVSRTIAGQSESSMSVLEKIMSPVVNLKKLPSTITPATVVMVSDDENDDAGSQPSVKRKPAQYSLEEKEAIALEAKRYGTTQVANSKNIPLPDILSWMTLFGLRNPGNQRLGKLGTKVNHEADLALVRWIVQQQEMNGCVDLNSMKQYALTVHQQTNPKFCASKTWLGNFLQRNMSVLQGTKFVHGDKGDELDVYGHSNLKTESVKQEIMDSTDSSVPLGENVLETLGQHTVLEDIPLNEQLLVNEAVAAGFDAAAAATSVDDNDDNDDSYLDDNDFSGANLEPNTHKPNIEMIQTPLGKKPIIIGQSRTFDAKSERKIVQWVLDRAARDGYVFTDDFKDYARSLYKGSKLFGATQAWMKKFLRRNRALKGVKFCSKFKNVYTTEDKVNCVSLAKRYGVTYASNHTGINQKVIHCWKLAYDKGMLNVDQEALLKIEALSSNLPAQTLPSSSDMPSTSSIPPSSSLFSESVLEQAVRGIVPEFERDIVLEIKHLQSREGSVNYNDISKISQSIYKETRPNFKASYKWVKAFLDRHKQALEGIELENVSKVLVENDNTISGLEDSQRSHVSDPKITEMVDKALQAIGTSSILGVSSGTTATTKEKRPIVIGPSVTFDRKTEKKLVDWALERQQQDGFVFTDDFKLFAKSVHSGPKNFTASSGWMTLFLRRHQTLKNVLWRSKYKNNYTEEEKQAAVAEARRLGAGPVGRKLGIEPKLICTWRAKLERDAPKQQNFWKGTKIRKFGKGLKPALPKFAPLKHTSESSGSSDAARGIVPEFEQRIVEQIIEEHEKEGSISYEEMSRIAQSAYKETRPTFKASYAWIRSFMKRNENVLPQDLNIENCKRVLYPEDEGEEFSAASHGNSDMDDSKLNSIFRKRPIIVGQSRSLDTKTEKKLVQWTLEQQEKNGYVFLDQFKSFAQSLYKGEKKFAATQAWRIKFLRRNHNALKHIKFQSSFRNQYTVDEKKAILEEAKKYGVAHVAKRTGIDHCLINAWRIKLQKSGDLPPDSMDASPSLPGLTERPNFASKVKEHVKDQFGPGLYSSRGIVPAFEQKIVVMIMNKMDDEGSVSFQDVSNFARAIYKETRPQFKASYNWIKDFIKRHKKELRHVEFETCKKLSTSMEADTEVIIPESHVEDIEDFLNSTEDNTSQHSEASRSRLDSVSSLGSNSAMDIVIDNPEDPNYDSNFQKQALATSSNDDAGRLDIEQIIAKRPIIIGKAVHFNRKTEKKIVDWLLETQNREGFVFTDDFRRYARSLYTGPPEKFGATNAWIAKFLRRNRLEGKIEFQSKLKGNNAKFEEKICELMLEQQAKEGSVSHEDIQKITQSVYKETRPNFRACYGWIKDFLKRNQDKLVGVDLENVKKVYIPDENEKDGVLIQNFDPTKNLAYLDTSTSSLLGQADERSNMSLSDGQSHDSSWFDLDSSVDLDLSRSVGNNSPRTVLEKLASQKRPIIIGPPRGMDSKTEKKLVKWMQEQQEKDGCVYLDLFKEYAKSVHSGPRKFAATQAWMTKFKQRNSEALKNVVIRSRFRNEYSVEEKLAIVEEAKRLGCNHVGRKLGINGGVIYSWKVQLEQMDRLDSGGAMAAAALETTDMSSSRGVVPEFENKIVEMVLETSRAKGSVTYDDISLCARSVYKETRPNFKASTNWVMDFIRNYRDRLKDVKIENQKKVYTEEEKLHILSEEKKYGTEHVVKKRNISSSTLYAWKRTMVAKSIPIPKYKAIVSSKIKKKYARGKNVKTYTLEEKRNMVALAEAKGVTHAALKLGVTRTMIGKWIRYFRDQGENIVIKATHSSTMKKELEQKVISWVLEENERLGIILTSRIVNQAKKIFEEAYTGFNATKNWLEGFLAQNADKFEKVRFRDEGDRDLDFSDDIKLKLSRYAEKHGANETSDLTGLRPKLIYHWRRTMKQKGFDLVGGPPVSATVKVEDANTEAEPKSLMQQKLDRIAAKFDTEARKTVVLEASDNGTSATAAKHKIPLPLLLKWMKQHLEGEDMESSAGSRSASSSRETPSAAYRSDSNKLVIKLPVVQKHVTKHSREFKKQVVEEARTVGVPKVVDKYNLKKTTVYAWVKEERENSNDSSNESVEKTPSSARSSLDRGTPIRVQDIKIEPGIAEKTPGSSTSNTNSSEASKSTRRYTDEQKFEAAKRASEIGYRRAASELGIPITNVQRWHGIYKDRLLSPGAEPKMSLDTAHFSLSTPNKKSLETIPNVIVSSNNTEDKSLKRKRSISEKVIPPVSAKRYKKYTDDEKIAFVQESEIIGTSATAAKAAVSLDLLYKWRSKYLKAIKQSQNEMSDEHSAETENSNFEEMTVDTVKEKQDMTDVSDVGSPAMPAPRNQMFDPASKYVNLYSPEKKSKDSHLAYLGMSVGETRESSAQRETDSDMDIGIDIVNKIDEQVAASLEGLTSLKSHSEGLFSKRSSSDVIVLSDEASSSPNVHAIDDIDIIAADQILEMTSCYMAAEKEHEKDPLGIQGKTRELMKDSPEMENKQAAGETLTAKKTEIGSGNMREKSEEGNIGMIQITNVKSEAAPDLQ